MAPNDTSIVPEEATTATSRRSQDVDTMSRVSGEQGQALYLRSINEQLMGWDDPRAMLERALRENHFMLLCQKILPLKSGAPDPRCYEVLLRLRQEEEKLLPPGGFLDIAESLGMMADIDRWVVRTLLKWGAETVRSGAMGTLPLMCVNVSTAALVDPRFPGYVGEELRKSGYPARALCFEINEYDVIEHHESAQRFISAMKTGVRFTLDAFGSVKVSFSHLTGLAVDLLKIDGSVIQNVMRDPSMQAKVRAIAHASQRTGLRTIGEQVETQETFDKLREIGLDYVQGFGIARPEPLSKLS